MAFRTFVRLFGADTAATTIASTVDAISRRKRPFSHCQSGCEFNRALLRAKCCRGCAEEASKVTVEMRLVTEARGGGDFG